MSRDFFDVTLLVLGALLARLHRFDMETARFVRSNFADGMRIVVRAF